MSRHSKNNTANSVFTYAEKQKLLGSYGTIKARIGQDSQKLFDQCFLCFQSFREPMTCLKGHIFCKECILDALVIQKKKVKALSEDYNNKMAYQKKHEELKKREFNDLKTLEFEREQFELESIKKIKEIGEKFYQDTALSQKDIEILEKKKQIDSIRNKMTLGFNNKDMKKELIQTSFWMAEADKSRMEDIQKAAIENPEKPPSQDMLCPADGKHAIKLKRLYPLKLEKVDGSYNCFFCQKKLMFQKIKGLVTCGHVMCADCVDKYCTECETEGEKLCLCGKKWKKGDCIALNESLSAFSFHNEVEVSRYTPAFAI